MGPTTIDALLAEARSVLDRLEPVEAHGAVGAGGVIVDTRDEAIRMREGTIPGSVHVPLSVLYWRLDPASPWNEPALADHERTVIVMCSHGFSSSLAAATMQRLGFPRATDLAGGFEAWRDAGLPVDPPPVRGS